MMINGSSPDAKRPRTGAGGVAGPDGDVRKERKVQTLLPQQKHHHYRHHHKQQQQTEGEDMRLLRSPCSCRNQHAGESQRDPKIYCLCTGNIFFLSVHFEYHLQFIDQSTTLKIRVQETFFVSLYIFNNTIYIQCIAPYTTP